MTVSDAGSRREFLVHATSLVQLCLRSPLVEYLSYPLRGPVLPLLPQLRKLVFQRCEAVAPALFLAKNSLASPHWQRPDALAAALASTYLRQYGDQRHGAGAPSTVSLPQLQEIEFCGLIAEAGCIPNNLGELQSGAGNKWRFSVARRRPRPLLDEVDVVAEIVVGGQEGEWG